ncbi:MAG: phosphoribosylformylglycinamidine synthase I [Chloroflexi bacterium]|nr:phosphoribosylformylglycinamidine synthase I [Chloroflexota bacterium]
MKRPRVMILHAPGTNRDRDAAVACELAGGEPSIVHINRVIAGADHFANYQMLVLPGGFSYGDDLGAGRLWASDLTIRFRDEMDRFVAEGKPVLGICNGFQALVKAGYLPGPAPEQRVTLTFNRRGHFECRWVRLRAVGNSRCLFTKDLKEDILCPVAHGEGRLAVPDEPTRRDLWHQGLVALRYVQPIHAVDVDRASRDVAVWPEAGYPANPNGSVDDIAGICNLGGNVLGLMPHPENHIWPHQHPRWSRGAYGGLGLALFRNGVRAALDFV